MTKLTFENLADVPHSDVLGLLKRAFTGREIASMEDEDHLSRWKEVGVDWKLSQGAFIEQKLAAAALLVPLPEGALNLATMVDGGLQGQGLGSKLLEHVLGELKDRELSFLGLEVEASNAAAIRTYTRVGFRITRRLESLKGVLSLYPSDVRGTYDVRPLRPLPSHHYGLEHRDEILQRHAQDFELHELHVDGECVAFCVYRPLHQAIVKLEARQPFAKHAEALLVQMKLSGEMVGIVNIEDDHTELIDLLEGRGLVRYLVQFEMRKLVL